MNRFFDICGKNIVNRKLNLADMGLGDASIGVVSSILKKNSRFAQLDMRKNFLSNAGLKTLAHAIGKNTGLVHISLGCNQFSSEGAC